MKISKAEKQKTYRKIVEAAVAVISDRGFRDATMHDIAERAQVGDATIYKYFPTKEHLLFGFFELRIEDLIERLKGIDGFHAYSFREQLHIVLETQLELFADDRAFLRTAYRNAFFTNWIAMSKGAKTVRDRFFTIIDDLFVSAIEVGEFEEPPFKKILYQLIWEYGIGITYYWLEDESPQYANTTQVIDKSLAVFDATLKSRILGTMVDLAQFLIREHFLSKLQTVGRTRDATLLSEKMPFLARSTPAPSATPRRKTSTTKSTTSSTKKPPTQSRKTTKTSQARKAR